MSSTQTNDRRSIDRMMVRLEHLDKLLSLAGEVIITSSTLHELQRDLVDSASGRQPVNDHDVETVKAADESTRRISQDLHDLVMAIRMVEVGETFRLFRRPVRDLCRTLGKEVNFRLEGEDVLVDKALAERLVDPLLHILRNAVDHGIEMPMERVRAEKPEEGAVTLRAVDHENHTELIVVDDGRGVDYQEVLAKARERGIVHANETPDLSEILCAPGFSTRDEATKTSGRGVGLDIARTLAREFDGAILVESEPGVGTTFRMQIPKLRAVNIIDALTVRAGDQYFALDIERVVSLQAYEASTIHSTMEAERFIRYLGDTIALFDLRTLLGGAPLPIDGLESVPVVILEGKRQRIAAIVSEFLSPQKLVNVPLDMTWLNRRTSGIAGTCVLGGGRVGLTVDVDEVVAQATGEDHCHTAESMSDDFWSGSDESPPAPAAPKETPDEPPAAAPTAAPKPTASTASAVQLSDGDVHDLVNELRRGLASLQDTLLSLESNSDDADLMNDAFRKLHKTKGNLTMLQHDEHSALAHRMETVLDFLRNDRMVMTSDLMDLLLDGLSALTRAADALPGEPPAPEAELVEKLQAEVDENTAATHVVDDREIVGKSFSLCPTVELQLVAALKRGENTFETFLRFQAGRQAEFLVAYLLLRRLGRHGTILATLPEVDEIEQGQCGGAVKVLWTTALDDDQLRETMEHLSRQYNVVEHQSLPTTIFRYERTTA